MSIVKKVGITAAVLATGFLGYGIYKCMQDEDEKSGALDDATDFDEEEADEEVFEADENDVVYG